VAGHPNYLIDDPMTEINCVGQLDFNFKDFPYHENFDKIEFWSSFYEIKNNEIIHLNEVGIAYSETLTVDQLKYYCNENNPDAYMDIYYGIDDFFITGKLSRDAPCFAGSLNFEGIIPLNYNPVTFYDFPNYQNYLNNLNNPVEIKKKTSGGNEYDTRSTFGLDHKTFKPVVTCGFKYDDTCFNITNNWHTDFEQKNILVGEYHTFEIKTYAEKKIKLIELSLGISSVGNSHKAELKIPVTFDYDGNIINYEIVGDSDTINNLTVNHVKSKCLPSDEIEKCDTVIYGMIFYESLYYNIMSMQAIDQKLI